MDTGPDITERADGRIHVQHGPIDVLVTIDATVESRATALAAIRATCDGLLAALAADLDQLRSDDPERWAVNGPTAASMVDTAARVRDLAFVTPMAAVAGAVADTICSAIVAEFGGEENFRGGIERIIVNNGGDIAFALADDAAIEVALADVLTGEVTGTVRVHSSDPVRGIATSGRHGRSLTMGLADSVTVFARSAAAADVAATMVASAVDLPGSTKVTRARACDIDAASDLGHREVVTGVAELDNNEETRALDAGLQLAQRLLARSAIVAAYLKLGRSAASIPAVEHGSGQLLETYAV